MESSYRPSGVSRLSSKRHKLNVIDSRFPAVWQVGSVGFLVGNCWPLKLRWQAVRATSPAHGVVFW
jgi:hypothetical protein